MTEGGVNISNIHGSSIHAHNIVGRDLVIQNFINGLNQVPLDYGTNIQNFLYEYLGSPEQRVPFGGRDHDLASLTTWLDNPEAPRALLLTAEAGRGKSALLVRWSMHLQQRDDLAVIFVPVSIRFETAAQEVFFAALAARLAQVYGQPLKYQPMGGEQWKALCHEYLKSDLPDGKRVVLILDGLDEAAGWQVGASFMPMPLPSGVQVVASVRVQAGKVAATWLRQLGWHPPGGAHSITLSPLTRAGVEHVLLQMGNPLDVLVTQVDIIGELFRLTEGDPLLVRLYVDELVTPDMHVTGLTAEQLGSIQPGLEGYFEQWWDDQQFLWDAEHRNPLNENHVRTFFHIVATALGPLSREDIITLTHDEGLDGIQIKAIAAKVGRFIIGDGVTQGFAFSHPRLGYYFFDLLGKGAQGTWNDRFIKMGRAFLLALRESKQTVWSSEHIYAHSYIVQNYANHLGRSGATHELYYELICHEWAQAWEALRGTYDGFLGDVKRVWEQAKYDPDEVRGTTMQLWCGLCQSSIITLNSNIPSDLIVGATKVGVFSKSQVLVVLQNSHRNDEVMNIFTLCAINFGHDREFLLQLLEVACTITEEEDRTRVFTILAPHLPLEVLEIARTITNMGSHTRILMTLAPYLPSKILQATHAILDEFYRTCILKKIASHLPSGVLEMALAIRKEYYRAEVLTALAPYLPSEVLEMARAMTEGFYRTRVLTALATHLPSEVLEAANAIREEHLRAEVLTTLALYLPSEVLEAAHAINNERDRSKVLISLAPHLPLEVLSMARIIMEERFRTELLMTLAPNLPVKVLGMTYTISEARYRNRVLRTLTPYLPDEVRRSVLEEALKAVYAIPIEWYRAEILKTLAPHLPLEVLEMARAISNKRDRARTLATLALYLPDEERRSVLEEALKAARAIRDEVYRTDVLMTLIPHLPDEERRSVFQQTLKAVHNITYQGHYTEVLKTFAPHLPSEVLEAAHAITNEKDRTRILKTLAPHAPSEVLEATRAITNGGDRARTMTILAPYLPDEEQRSVLAEALMAARAIRDEHLRTELLMILSHYLPDEEQRSVLAEALMVARAIREDDLRTELLITIAPCLPFEVLEMARASTEKGYRTQLLKSLAPYLPSEVLEMARTVREEHLRTELLITIAPYLPSKVLEVAHAIREGSYRTRVLTALAPYLPSEVLKVVGAIREEHLRTELLITIAPYLPDEGQYSVLEELLMVARTSTYTWYRTALLKSLASYLPLEVLEMARAITNDRERAQTMTMLVSHLPYKAQQSVLGEALKVARASTDTWYRTQLLKSLAPYLPSEVLEMARAVEEERFRTELLIILVPYLPYKAQQSVLEEVLKVARASTETWYRTQLLKSLAPYLPSEVLEMARAVGEEHLRTELLIILAPYLPSEVLEMVCAIMNESNRNKILTTLAPQLADIAISQPNKGIKVWKDTVQNIATRPRPVLLSDLQALMPFTLTLFQNAPSFAPHIVPDVTVAQRSLLLRALNLLPLATTPARLHLLENAGIPELEPHLHFNTPQAAFVQDLLRVVTDAGNAPDGEPYLVKLLRYLHDVEWAGHPDRRAFIRELLGTSTPSSNQTRLAQRILEAVQAVCTWWP